MKIYTKQNKKIRHTINYEIQLITKHFKYEKLTRTIIKHKATPRLQKKNKPHNEIGSRPKTRTFDTNGPKVQ